VEFVGCCAVARGGAVIATSITKAADLARLTGGMSEGLENATREC
jgi:hypothetical protein